MNMFGDLARSLDPTLLAHDVGLELDGWQRDLLFSTADREILLCARQTGKTTICALIAVRDAVYRRPGGLVIVVSPSQRQSAEMLRAIVGMLGKLGVGLHSESVLKVELANHSRILALPGDGKTVRGFSAADLLIIDEAARCPDELYVATRPMLATSGGRLIMLSTPAGTRGFFYESWVGSDAWHRVQVGADQCPRIGKAFLDEEPRELGAQRFSEEYQLAWLDPCEAVFPVAVIDRAFDPAVRALWVS